MAKEWAKAFYHSKAWLKCRESYINQRISIDGGMCEKCGNELGYIVHHIIELTQANINDATISLNTDNLRYDCKKCHDEEDNHFIKRVVQGCAFDSEGNPIPLSPP